MPIAPALSWVKTKNVSSVVKCSLGPKKHHQLRTTGIYAQEGAAELWGMNNLPLLAAVKLLSKGFYKGTLITHGTSPHLPSMPNIALDFNHFDSLMGET